MTSPTIKLLDHVFSSCNKATPHSWERINHAMRHALRLAIGAGFSFDVGDVAKIRSHYSSGYWIGDSDEWIYSEAIIVGNIEAIKSYEAFKVREPFIADDVRPESCSHDFSHGVGQRHRDRLYIGASFEWKGVKVKVTSFADDSSYLTACSYKAVSTCEVGFGDKIDKRFKITRDDIFNERSERKERSKILDQLTKVGRANMNTADIVKALGVKTKTDYARLSLEKISKVVKRFCHKE